MFFYLSKLFWYVIEPGNLFLLTLLLSIGFLWSKWHKAARLGLVAIGTISLLIAILPFGSYTISILENRFKKPDLAGTRIDGIIVLGGVISPALSNSRNELSFGSATERLVAFAALGKKYPEARLVFTGGSGDPFHPELSEASIIKPFLELLEMDNERIIFEGDSRNTTENAAFTYDMLKPQKSENWLLITSAFHMPRAMGCFRKVGWNISAYPVDFTTKSSDDIAPVQFNFTRGLAYLSTSFHEVLGLVSYYALGKTDEIFPGPQ